MNIHDRQPRHHERTKRTNIDRRIDRLKNTDDQLFEFRIADDDLSVAGAADHTRISAVKCDDLYTFLHFLHIAVCFIERPFCQAIKAICQTPMRIRIVNVIEPSKAFAALDQRRNAASEAIRFRIAFTQFGRQHVGQLDLADLGFDLGIRHTAVNIMLKPLFTEQGDEQFLRQVGVGDILPFFDQEPGPF